MLTSQAVADSALADLLKKVSYSFRALLTSDSDFGSQPRLERLCLFLNKPENLAQDVMFFASHSGLVRRRGRVALLSELTGARRNSIKVSIRRKSGEYHISDECGAVYLPEP